MYKETKRSQEIALRLGLSSGFMNSDQTIDKYFLSYLAFASDKYLLNLFAQIGLSFLPFCTHEATR